MSRVRTKNIVTTAKFFFGQTVTLKNYNCTGVIKYIGKNKSNGNIEYGIDVKLCTKPDKNFKRSNQYFKPKLNTSKPLGVVVPESQLKSKYNLNNQKIKK